MDDSRRSPTCRFGPDRRLTLLCAVLAVGGAVFVVLSGDAAGRVLVGVAAALLGGYAVTDVAFWPRLIASGSGLQIRTPTTRTTLPWSDVADVRVDERSHLGLLSRTLEIDAGTLLVVFSRRTLGADPREVADLLDAFRR
jgi:hypothetical protein